MSLNLILDKSSFQQLNRDEHAECSRHFIDNVTPVLLREILGDLSKEAKPGTTSMDVVSSLARKFLGSGGPINHHYSVMCVGELNGNKVPIGHGQILPDNMLLVEEPDGSPAYLLQDGPGNRAVMRWAQRDFLDGEHLRAKRLRDTAQAFSIDSMHARLRKRHVILPRPKNLQELPAAVERVLAEPGLQSVWLSWALEELALPFNVAADVRAYWQSRGGPRLTVFAPYVAHCVRAFLLLLVGTLQGILTARPTNRVDLEYLLYLPFCEVFVSDDRFHRQLAPGLLSDYQSFVEHREFRADLQQRRAARMALEPAAAARRAFAFGSYPWPVKGSVLTALWLKRWGPWYRGRGNRAIKLSEAEQEQALTEAEELVRASQA